MSSIDRLANTARTIHGIAVSTAPVVVGPYARAVLCTHLGDLIRDIDSSELGLFTPSPGLTRTEFTLATPLRKVHSRCDPTPKVTEYDPEAYANAAIKCIDRYKAVRSMPRAHSQASDILKKLEVIRKSMHDLDVTFVQTQSAPGRPINSLIKAEENRINVLQLRIIELNHRKQDALSKQKEQMESVPRSFSKPFRQVTPPLATTEDQFWNTPGTTLQTLHFTDNLMDEHVDADDAFMNSFATPSPPSVPKKIPIERSEVLSMVPESDYRSLMDTNDNEYGRDDGVESAAKVNSRLSNQNTPETLPLSFKGIGNILSLEAATSSTKQMRFHINNEVETHVAKLWATIGDTIMPGHSYDVSGCVTENKPPRARETILYLRSLATSEISPSSPSASSISFLSGGVVATPTAQQILTAHLILALLSSPSFSMPLNEAKALLNSKANPGGSAVVAGQGTTRIVYGCVAKRLIKIERGKGEQIIKFDT